MDVNESKILLFDGVCNLCNSMVQFVIKRDSKGVFKFASMQSSNAELLLRKYEIDRHNIDSVIYIRNGEVYTKSHAIFMLCKDIGGFWKFVYYFHFLPKSFCDFLYDLVAKYRYKIFGKKNTCMIPKEEIKSRFL